MSTPTRRQRITLSPTANTKQRTHIHIQSTLTRLELCPNIDSNPEAKHHIRSNSKHTQTRHYTLKHTTFTSS
eukprot:1330724-Amorphochlora_amoeboformis.AAC.1